MPGDPFLKDSGSKLPEPLVGRQLQVSCTNNRWSYLTCKAEYFCGPEFVDENNVRPRTRTSPYHVKRHPIWACECEWVGHLDPSTNSEGVRQNTRSASLQTCYRTLFSTVSLDLAQRLGFEDHIVSRVYDDRRWALSKWGWTEICRILFRIALSSRCGSIGCIIHHLAVAECSWSV